MKRFVYIITDTNRTVLNIGISSDLLKTVAFYNSIPSLELEGTSVRNRLVYFEDMESEVIAQYRADILNSLTRMQKEKLVRSLNPDWIDFTMPLKLDLEMDALMEDVYERYKTQEAA